MQVRADSHLPTGKPSAPRHAGRRIRMNRRSQGTARKGAVGGNIGPYLHLLDQIAGGLRVARVRLAAERQHLEALGDHLARMARDLTSRPLP